MNRYFFCVLKGRSVFLFFLLFYTSQVVYAQKSIGVGTDKPNPKAVLELSVEDPVNFPQGFLLPRLTTAQRTVLGASLNTSATGMSVYDLSDKNFYLWNGIQWSTAGSVSIVGTGGIAVSSSGSIVTVNGSGIASQWTTSGANIYYDKGNVGIGTNNPNSILHVESQSTTGDFIQLKAPNLLPGNNTVFMQGVAGSFANLAEYRFTYVGPGNLLNAHSFGFNAIQPFVHFTAAQNVGIGTSAPDQKLVVSGNSSVTGITYTNNLIINSLSGGILSVDGLGNVVLGNPSSAQTQNTITGINGVSIVTGTGYDFTINGANFITSIVGGNGILINKAGQLVTITSTLIGSQFTTSGSNIATSYNTSVSGFITATGIGSFGTIIGTNLAGAAGSVVTVDGAGKLGRGIVPSGSGAATQVTYWSSPTGLTGSPTFTWDNTSSLLGLGGSSIKATHPYNVYIGGGGTGSQSSGTQNIYIGNNVANGAPNSGVNNLIIGWQAGFSLTTGQDNVFLGSGVANNNNVGSRNAIVGKWAGFNSISGNDNVFIGYNSGLGNSIGSNNILIGSGSDVVGNLTNAIAIGYQSIVSTSNTMLLGGLGANAVKVGIGTTLPGQSLVVVGNTSATGVGYFGTIIGNNMTGAPVGSVVTVDGTGKLGYGTLTSSIGGSGTGTGIAYFINSNTLTSDGQNFTWDGTVLGIRGSSVIVQGGAINNFFVGSLTGNATTTGANNNIFGFQSGNKLTSGGDNNVFGFQAGKSLTSGSTNNFMGVQAGFNSNGSSNNYFGYRAGFSNNGIQNNIIGHYSGYFSTGSQNNFMGFSAAYNSSGSYNNTFGWNAGYENTSGSFNVFIGYNAGRPNTTGNGNIAIGSNTGYSLGTFNNAIVIGNNASVGGSNMLMLGGIQGSGYEVKVGIGTALPSQELSVIGNVSATGIGYFGTIIGNNMTGAPVGSVVTVDGTGKLGYGTIATVQTQNTITGINGVSIVTGTGYDFTINGANFITSIVGGNGISINKAGQLVTITSTLIGSQFTTSGSNIATSYNTSVAGFITATGIGSFGTIIGNNMVGAPVGSVVTVDGAGKLGYGTIATVQTQNTITGINGVSIVTGTGYDFTINGANFITSIVGGNGISINKAGQLVTITSTLLGSQFTTSGSNIATSYNTSVAGFITATGIGSFGTIIGNNMTGAPVGSVVTVDGTGKLGYGSLITNSQWTTTGNNIYYDKGNVSIGSTGSGAALSVLQDASVKPALQLLGGATKSVFLELGRGSTDATIGVAGNASTISGLASPGDFVIKANAVSSNLILAAKNTGGNILFSTGLADNLSLFINTAGNIGIGTTLPGATFDVNGNARIRNLSISGSILTVDGLGNVGMGIISSSSPSWQLGGNSIAGALSTILGTTSNSPMGFYTNGAERMIIDQFGRIGVGVGASNFSIEIAAAPSGGLRITGSPSTNPIAQFINTGAGNSSALDVQSQNSGSAIKATNTNLNGSAGNFIVNNVNSTGAALIINSNSTTSGSALDVTGNIRFTSYNTAGAVLTVDGAGNVGMGTISAAPSWQLGGNAIAGGGVSTILGTSTNVPVGFYTNGTERMQITPVGNVGINNPLPLFSAALDLIGYNGGPALNVLAGPSGGSPYAIRASNNSASTLFTIQSFNTVSGGGAALFSNSNVSSNIGNPVVKIVASSTIPGYVGLEVQGGLKFSNLSIAGSVLTVDGLGNVGMGTISAGASQWLTTTGGIYTTSAVGIGVNTFTGFEALRIGSFNPASPKGIVFPYITTVQMAAITAAGLGPLDAGMGFYVLEYKNVTVWDGAQFSGAGNNNNNNNNNNYPNYNWDISGSVSILGTTLSATGYGRLGTADYSSMIIQTNNQSRISIPASTLAGVSIGLGNFLQTVTSTLSVKGDIGLGDGTSTNNGNIVVWLTNSNGSAITQGSIVVVGTSDDSFNTTLTASDNSVIGVLTENCPSGNSCRVAVSGVATVNVNGGSTRGQHCVTSAVGGQALSVPVPSVGASIGVFLQTTAGTSARVLLR